MGIPQIQYCPGTLASGHDSYSRSCLKKVFSNRKVIHILPYNSPHSSDENAEQFRENRSRLSISGVQEKLAIIQEKNKLRLSEKGELSTHILKPVPAEIKNADQAPANEHLTMQIAKQVYGINTAENALIFFQNGEPAYITKRFDYRDDHTKWGQEDFATLAGKTEDNAGKHFKYDYSYEELAELIKKYIPAFLIELEKFFSMILFNFLYSNGDAHLKNFAILESENGDYLLSPAYDLINTRLHIKDEVFALKKGLFADNFRSPHFKKFGHPGEGDFTEFANRIGIKQTRLEKIFNLFFSDHKKVNELIQHSFLREDIKKKYLAQFDRRRSNLNS